MAQIQKLDAEIELKCPANKFYGMCKENLTHLAKDFPETFKSIQVIEGDGPSVGSVRSWNFLVDGKSIRCKERTKFINDENRSITWNLFEGDVMNLYNSLDFKLVSVTPKGGEGSVAKWSIEFEKANEDVPAPTAYMNLLLGTSKEVALQLLKQA